MGIFSTLFGGRGSSQGGSYSQVTVPSGLAGLPPYGIHSPGVADVGEAPATDATHRILNASTATLPTGWSEARSTTATYYNSSGVVSTASSNTLRNDYTSTGSLRGYLLEGAATNVMTWSQTINASQIPWHETTGNATVTATNVSDPAGGTTASTVNFVAAGGTGGTGGAVYQQQIAVSLGTVYTFSAWMRSSASGGASFVRFATNNSLAWNTGMGQKFTLTSTWTRYTMTGVVLTSAGVAGNVINIGFDSREPVGGTWDNTIAGNVDVWGIQLELGTQATSYIPTTTANVTRAADVASFTLDAAATDLALTYDDGSVTIYTGVPPGSTFNVPTSSTLRLLYVDDNVLSSINVAVSQALGALSQSFASTVADAAAYANTLGALQQTLATTIPDTAAINQTLNVLSQAATAAHAVYTLDPANKYTDIVLSNGNLTATYTTSNASFNVQVFGTQSGAANAYFEVTFTTVVTGQVSSVGVGVANLSQALVGGYPGNPNAAVWYMGGYSEWPGGSGSFGTFTTSDVLGVLLEASDVKFYKNGTLVGTATALPSGSLYPIISFANNTEVATANFGATTLSYLPSGATSWDGTQTISSRTAVVAQTLGGLVQTTAAAVTVAGVVAQTLGALSQTATATAIDTASVTQTLGALTQTVTSTVRAAAAVAQTLGALGQTTTATVQAAAAVAQTLGALSQSLTVTVANAAAVSQTLGALGQSATAAATDTATTSQTLGVLNQTATAIHQAASAVVNQTLGALGQTATAAATDTAAIAQTLGALQQALTAAATVAATTAQTLGALQQLAQAAVTDTATFQDNLGALQQTATGAAQVNAAVTQLLGDLGQTATVAVVGQAVVDQTLPSLEQELIIGDSRHAHVAETLGDLVQTATSTADIAAATAQNLGDLTQLTGATVNILVNTIQTLGTLAQAASATVPASDAIDALVAQALGVLGQAATGQVTVATAVSQILTSLVQTVSGEVIVSHALLLPHQVAAGTVLDRALLSQLLQGLQQAAATVLPPATTIMPESVVTVMYEHRILVVPAEARVLVVPGMYVNAFAGGGLGDLLGPVVRLPGEHLLPPIQQVLTTTGADLGPALPDNIIVLEEDNFSALLWEDGSFFEMEADTVSAVSIDNAVALEEGGFLLTEAGDTLGLEDATIQVIATLPDDLGLLLEDGSALLTEDGLFLGIEGIEALPAIDAIVLEEGVGFLLLEDGDILSLETGTVAPVVSPAAFLAQTLPSLRQAAVAAHAAIPAILTTWSPSDKASLVVLSNNNLTATMVLPITGGGGEGSAAGDVPRTIQVAQTLPQLQHIPPGVATWNPSDVSGLSLSNGNLTATGTGTGGAQGRGAKAGSGGKYFELHIDNGGASGGVYVGLANLSQNITTGFAGNPNGICYFNNGYAEWPGGSGSGGNFNTNDIIGIRLLSSTAEFYLNGTLQFTTGGIPAGAIYPIVGLYNSGAAVTANFGATAFTYAPSGAVAWNT